MHAEGIPYQIFPGIFSTLDSYSKRLVHGWFDRGCGVPPWLASLGDIRGYVDPPHYSKFCILDRKANVLLRGTPDGILVKEDGSYIIIDYKTAKFTPNQDALFPMYEVQLNAYAVIGEQTGISPVSALALVYTEPVSDAAAVSKDSNQTSTGFMMEFSAHIRPVDLAPEIIPSLLAKVRRIYDFDRPPAPGYACEDCALLQGLLDVAAGRMPSVTP